MHLAGLVLLSATLSAQNQAQLKVPDSVVLERDIDYANAHGARLQMDVARPRGDGPFPTIVMIHGGGFRGGNRQSYVPMAVRLAERGFVAATITYRLSPKYQFPAPVFDTKSAVRFLRANAGRFHIDADNIGAMGGSAGGHLALMLGLTGGVASLEGEGPNPEQSSRIKCVVNYYGPADFTRIYDKGGDAAQVLPQFLGGSGKTAQRAHIQASPLNWISPDDPPVLTIHGTKDPLVPYEHGVWITERLIANGVEAELATMSGAGHGFRGKDAEDAERRTVEFFEKHLKPKPAGRKVFLSNHARTGEVMAVDWPSGKVLFTVPNAGGHDVQALPNGNVLLTRDSKGTVVEVTPQGREVWSYSEGLKRPLSAQRLENGNTLIGDTLLGKVIEVTPQGKTVWTYENADLGNGRMRESRRTPQGTTLIAIEAAGKIIEVDAAGKTIWSHQFDAVRKPYLAIRLPNGNTMVSNAEPGEVVEVDRAGKVVRSIGSDDRVKMGWASGFAPQPDGSVFIVDYTGRRVVEVNAKGDLVNEIRNSSWSIASISTN